MDCLRYYTVALNCCAAVNGMHVHATDLAALRAAWAGMNRAPPNSERTETEHALVPRKCQVVPVTITLILSSST